MSIPESSDLKLAICQLNSVVADIEYNANRIIDYINLVKEKDIDLMVFPELALTGYQPKDFLHYKRIFELIAVNLDRILEASRVIPNTYLIVGLPIPSDLSKLSNNKIFYNSAYFIQNGKIIERVDKTLIPNYDVFDEDRYYIPGEELKLISIKGYNIGLEICEDMWDHLPYHKHTGRKITRELADMGADLIVNISASPFISNKFCDRLKIVKNHVDDTNLPFVYVNSVGGQDEITFDGQSFAVSKNSELMFHAPAFEEGIYYVSLKELLAGGNDIKYEEDKFEMIFSAIRMNLRDYLSKIGFTNKVVIGLSGGIDSALTAQLAVLSLGKDRVLGISMPSRYSSDHSIGDAEKLAQNLGIELLHIPIADIHSSFEQAFSTFSDQPENVADENIQARIRGNILMYVANKFGYFVLSTGNKSEIAVGYCTLYGDTNGSKNLIGDLYKQEVYALARHINQRYPEATIPLSTINKEPSAELKPDQKDSDSLPEYSLLDEILVELIEKRISSTELIQRGYDTKMVNHVVRLINRSEFKRAQLVQTVKIHEYTFGVGRHVPISSPFEI